MTSLQFLYRDDDIFALYKPPGIHSVKLPTGGGTSLAEMLLAHEPRLAHASRSELDAGLVQRLDFETSGVILGAWNRRAWSTLFESLMSGAIRKFYVALATGEVTKELQVSSCIGSPHRGAHKVKVYTSKPPASARTLPGVTTFTPIRLLPQHNATLVQASASPARRHQVRAHAEFCGHPLVGDSLYGSGQQLGNLCAVARGFFLHSWRLSFEHPMTQEQLTLESDYAREIIL